MIQWIADRRFELLVGFYLLFLVCHLVATVCLCIRPSWRAAMQWAILACIWGVCFLEMTPSISKQVILTSLGLLSLLAMVCGGWDVVRSLRHRVPTEGVLATCVTLAGMANALLLALDWLVEGNWGIA